MMDNKDFDKYIKEQLSQHRSSGEADWESMQKILLDEDILQGNEAEEDQAFDELVKDEMAKVKTPYRSDHWNILRERLLLQAYLKKRITIVKITELAMVLLFLWTAITLMPVHNEGYQTPPTKPGLKDLPTLFVEQVKSLFTSPFKLSPQKVEKIQRINSNVLPVEELPFIFPVEEPKENIDIEKDDVEPSLPIALNLRPVPSLDQEIKSDVRDIDSRYAIYIAPERKEENVVSIASGLAVNHIKPVYSKILRKLPNEVTSAGSHMALTYGVKNDRAEFFTGLGYHSAEYTPADYEIVASTLGSQNIPMSEIEDIRYRYLYLPLGARYHIFEKEKWGLFAETSVSFETLTNVDYGQRELTENEQKAFSTNTSFTSSLSRRSNDIPLKRGVFQGGSIMDNFACTASLGVGVYRNVGDVSFFFQPSFNHNFTFSGSGTQREEIGKVRLDLGIRKRI